MNKAASFLLLTLCAFSISCNSVETVESVDDPVSPAEEVVENFEVILPSKDELPGWIYIVTQKSLNQGTIYPDSTSENEVVRGSVELKSDEYLAYQNWSGIGFGSKHVESVCKLPRLASVCLRYFEGITPKNVIRVLSIPSLEHAHMRTAGIDYTPIFSSAEKFQIKTLIVSGAVYLTDDMLEGIVDAPLLTSLHFRQCYSLTGDFLSDVDSVPFNTLEFWYCGDVDTGIWSPMNPDIVNRAAQVGITHLSISECNFQNEVVLDIPDDASWKELTIEMVSIADDREWEDPSFIFIQPLPKSLTKFGCSPLQVGIRHFNRLFENIEHLETLQFSGPFHMAGGVIEIKRIGLKVENLVLLNHWDEDGMIEAAFGIKGLKTLSIYCYEDEYIKLAKDLAAKHKNVELTLLD